MTSQRPEHRGICRHDGHTISSHIQVPRRDEIGDCPGFDPVTTEHPKDCQCLEHRPMTADEQEISDDLAGIFS